MEKEKISVIIPTYNREKTIKRAVDSVLNQTYNNLEVIIVDDCSIDNTKELVDSWNNDKVKYFKLEKNSGACAARNKGIELATGEYIAFQDSDDEWFPDKLEKQMKLLKNTNTEVTFCAFEFITLDGKNNKKVPEFDVNNIENMTKELLNQNFISTQTLLGKKSVFISNQFDKTLPRFQDWDLAIRLSKKYKISYLDEILVNLYVQNDSITMNKQKGYEAFKILYDKYHEDIEEDINIKYKFKTNIATLLFNMGKPCSKELKESLKVKFNMKILIYYISSITHTSGILLKLKNYIMKEK